jgi:hypothetical protein
LVARICSLSPNSQSLKTRSSQAKHPKLAATIQEMAWLIIFVPQREAVLHLSSGNGSQSPHQDGVNKGPLRAKRISRPSDAAVSGLRHVY